MISEVLKAIPQIVENFHRPGDTTCNKTSAKQVVDVTFDGARWLCLCTDPPGAPSSLAPRPALLRATRTNMGARASVVVAAAAVSASGLKAFGLTV